MNRKQLIVLWAGVGVVALMLLFPPWRIPETAMPLGYWWILSPPNWGTCSELDDWGGVPMGALDYHRLLAQWLVVAAITAALILTLKDRGE